jgi:hypothetical protein
VIDAHRVLLNAGRYVLPVRWFIEVDVEDTNVVRTLVPLNGAILLHTLISRMDSVERVSSILTECPEEEPQH